MILREKKKTKVYELSRALKLKETELLSILEALGIEVSTKFSPLDEADVDKVKNWCRQNQGPGMVEKKVGSGIRRRRRKSADKPAAGVLEEAFVEEDDGDESEVEAPAVIEAEIVAVEEGPAPAFEPGAEPDDDKASLADEIPQAEAAPPQSEVSVEEEPVDLAATGHMTAAAEPLPETGTAELPLVAEAETEVLSEEEIEEPEAEPKAGPTEDESAAAAGEPAGAEALTPTTEEKPRSPRGPRGARVIGRVALSELDTQTAGWPGRGKPRRKPGEPDAVVAAPAAAPPAPAEADDRGAGKKSRKSRKKEGADTPFARDDDARRKGSRRAIIKNLDFSDERGGKGRKKGSRKKAGQKTEITMPKQIKRVVKITDAISVGELARKMGIKAGEVIAKLMTLGSMVTINQMIDYDTAVLVADEYGHTVENVAFDEELLLESGTDNPDDLVGRPPVVTIMGHVDHGKTSLLDAIRLTRVADGEAGGITQHIGAYMVSLPHGNISFVDTPGHEAFTSMRSRGAGVTDIVILVVAADDGVMPTTIESINHARAAKVPIIVAINKIDKDNARPDEVRRQLADYGLVAEDWGGDTIFVEVSAKKRLNLETLLEMILLQAEMMELNANPEKAARGVVLESRLDRGKGPVATVLVQDGSVKQGDFVVAGLYSGRVRALLDDMGQQVDSAGPSMPVEVLGLNGVPAAGDDFNVVKSEKQAKELTSNRQHKAREQEISKTSKISLEDLFEQMEEGAVEQLNVIVKGDVQGSVEAVSDALRKQATAKVKVEVVHAAVGGVKEADVMLAAASQAIIVAFNVRPDLKAQHLAEQEKVDIRLYSVIYDLIEDLRMAMEGLLAPEVREVYLGRAEVRQAFMVSKVGMIAGCRVVDGKVRRNSQVRLLRDNVVIVEGKISSLKRFKDDAKEVTSGFECGIGIENYNDIKPGDVIEAYVMEEVAAKL